MLDEFSLFGVPAVVCYACGWNRHDSTGTLEINHLRKIAVLHTLHRHPDIYVESTGRTIEDAMQEYGHFLTDPIIVREL